MNKRTVSPDTKRSLRALWVVIVALLVVHAGMAVRAFAGEAARVEIDTGSILVTPADPGVTYMMLRVGGPWGDVISEESSGGEPIRWSPAEGAEDGLYTWEVRVGFSERKTSRDESPEGAELVLPWLQSGTVTVRGGAILPPTEKETGFLGSVFSVACAALGEMMDFLVPPAYADQVILDNLIVDGSLGVGGDSYNGQSFGFDTIQLKENNLRIYFDDTSTVSSYPRNDWRIIINDSTNGGSSYFAVEDSSAGRVPFKIEAGAPVNSLYIEDYGRIGIGTALPVLELHIADSDTPSIRLEQDRTGGWTPQTWDVCANESNFYIRDATHGSKLPFRIQPNTPSETLCLKSDDGGRVGIGTQNPQAKLHVAGNALVLGNLEVGSSQEFKERIQTLQAKEAMEALRDLRPVRFHYKADPKEETLGFISEEVPDLVATNSRKSINTMDVVAVLARVAQEQQKVIEELSRRIVDLERELKAWSPGEGL